MTSERQSETKVCPNCKGNLQSIELLVRPQIDEWKGYFKIELLKATKCRRCGIIRADPEGIVEHDK